MTAYYPARGSAERILGQAQGAAGHVHPGYVQHFLGDTQPPSPRGGDMWTRGGSVEFVFTDLLQGVDPIDDFYIYETPGGVLSMRFVLPDGAADVQALTLKLSYAVADATYSSGTPRLDLILNSGTTLQVPLNGASNDLVLVETEIDAPADWLALAENESFLDVDYAVLPDEIAIYDLSIRLLRTGFVYSFDGAQWVLMSTGGNVIESHNQLIGRDAINAHPIAAITDLQTTLDGKADAGHPHAHGTLTGLDNDDHPQYLDVVRGYTRTLADQVFVNVIGDTMTGDLDVRARVRTDDLTVRSPDASHAAIEFEDQNAVRLAELSADSDMIEFRAIDGTVMAYVEPERLYVHGRLEIQPDGVTGPMTLTSGSGPPDNSVLTNGMGLYVDISAGSGPLWYTSIPGDNTTWQTIGVSAHDHDGLYVPLDEHGSADHSGLLAAKADITHVTSAEDPAGQGDLLHVQYPTLQPSDLAPSSSIGVSDTLARADHVHARPTLGELNAAAAAHTHDGSEIDSGTIGFARLPTGTSSSTVAVGDHTHAYVPTSRNLTAGAGLTGGGNLTANRSFSIGAGDGITVNADSIEINRTLVDSWYAGSGHGHTGTDDHSHAAYSPIGHSHAAGDIDSGTLALARIPTGTTSSTVALGNHAHSGVYDPAGSASSAISGHEGDADPHNQYQLLSARGAASGYAPLGADSIVPSQYLPAVAPTKYFNVADETERKTLSSYSPDGLFRGDNVIQASPSATFVYVGTTEPADQTALNDNANWQELASGGVQSINGQSGTVVLDHSDVGAPPDTRTISGGNGLTGGGNLTANRTLAVGAGTGISVGSSSVSIDRSVTDTWYADSGHSHTGSDDHSHSAYVPTSRSLTAGAGLTGGGSLASNRTFNVGAGTGISVAANAVSVDRATTDSWYASPTSVTSAIGTHSSSGDHDGRYYTESEIDAMLSGVAPGGHNHDSDYVNVNGDTMSGELRVDADFSASGMVRSGSDPANFASKPGMLWIREDDDTGIAGGPIFDPANYAAVGHLHAGIYSPVGHTHTGDFAASAHTHTGYANESHTHETYLPLAGGVVSGDLTVQGKLAQAQLAGATDPSPLVPGMLWINESDPGTELGDPANHTHDDRYVQILAPGGNAGVFLRGQSGPSETGTWTPLSTTNGWEDFPPDQHSLEPWWTWVAPYAGRAVIYSGVSFGYMTGRIQAWIRLNALCSGDYYAADPSPQRLYWNNETSGTGVDFSFASSIPLWLNAGASVTPMWQINATSTDQPRYKMHYFNMLFWADNGQTPLLATISRTGGVVPR